MITFLRDIFAFAAQIIPSPITLFYKYRFSPADLDFLAHPLSTGRISSPLAPIKGTKPANGNGNVIATIDILSYNLNDVAVRSTTRTRRTLHAIFSSGADVILLQETNPAWKDLLDADAMALTYPYSHFRHPGVNDRAAGGIAILSRYPLENERIWDFTKHVDGSVFPTLSCQVNVPVSLERSDFSPSDASGDSSNSFVTINIANVHLRPPVELDGSAWFETARKTEPIRINEVKELILRATSLKAETIMPTTARPPFHIIAGDFNEGDNAGGLSYLASLGYIDALKQYVPRYKETHTWPFMRNLFTLRKRLDHIIWHKSQLLSTVEDECHVKMQCIGCGVLTGYEVDASDHQPVLARFALIRV